MLLFRQERNHHISAQSSLEHNRRSKAEVTSHFFPKRRNFANLASFSDPLNFSFRLPSPPWSASKNPPCFSPAPLACVFSSGSITFSCCAVDSTFCFSDGA